MKSRLLILFLILLSTTCYGLSISNTTYYTSESNYSVHIDSATLTNVTVTNTTIELYGLNSTGTRLTNINATYPSTVNFYNLSINLTITNLNTSLVVFTSQETDRDVNITFNQKQVLQIGRVRQYTIQEQNSSALELVIIIGIAFLLICIIVSLIITKHCLKIIIFYKIIGFLIILGAWFLFFRQVIN